MSFYPREEYTITNKNIDLGDFYDFEAAYITRPAYQRKNVWSVKKQKELLDSLFRMYYVPRLVLREVRLADNKVVKEVIDGQQRIITVQNFIRGEIKLPESLKSLDPHLDGKYYSQLDVDIQRFFKKELSYDADIIKNIENPKDPNHQKVATEIFYRLQQGEPLNFMEKAHAKLSSLTRNFIVEYADDIGFDFESYEPIDFNKNKHPLFKEILNVNNQRMKHLQIMARFTMIEIADGYTELKDISVEDFINDNQYDNGIGNLSFKNKKEANETIFNLNLFYDIFKNDPIKDNKNGIKEFNVEYFIISFYLLIRHLRKHYIVDNSLKSHINSFMHEFYYRWRHASDNDLDIAIFSNNRQQSRNNLEIRDRILRQLFFAYLRENNFDLKEKDSKRVFSEDQKIAIYRRDNGLCQKCLVEGKSEKESLVSWSEFDADHILPHSRGGQTILENGQVLCRYHNQQKSNK